VSFRLICMMVYGGHARKMSTRFVIVRKSVCPKTPPYAHIGAGDGEVISRRSDMPRAIHAQCGADHHSVVSCGDVGDIVTVCDMNSCTDTRRRTSRLRF
jgi:hypothetical protein